jgi:PIN domain nuclease of toxin-antitoxin system
VAPLIYLDTHVAAWLFAGRTDLLPARVREHLEEHDLLVSPAVVLELQHLFEIRRTSEPARVLMETLAREVGLRVCELPFDRVVEMALDQAWTRDPFDRLIVSQAALRDAPLVTRDGHMHDHYPRCLWSK